MGTHLVDVSVSGHKLGTGTLLAKGYNSALIRVTDVSDAVVGQPCQFRGLFNRTIINIYLCILYMLDISKKLCSIDWWLFLLFNFKIVYCIL